MSPNFGSPARSIFPRPVALVIPKEDNWNTKKEAPVEDPPQTRYQKKQWDTKSDIPPGVVQLSPFSQKEFFKDFKEAWPSIHPGSSPKESCSDRGVLANEFSDDTGAKRMAYRSRQLTLCTENDSRRLGTATTKTSPSKRKSSSPASATRAAEPADSFLEDKWSPLHQRNQWDTNKEDIPAGKREGIVNVFGGSPTIGSATDFVSSVAANSSSPFRATIERSTAEKSDFVDGSTPSGEASKPLETRQEENGIRGVNIFGGLTDLESGPAATSSCPPSPATTERSVAEKRGREDDFKGTTPSNEANELRERSKEVIP
jgi:hypothetical protein